MNQTQWDYEAIRQSRAAEQAATPTTPPPEDSSEASQCLIMTHSQVVRSKASGCRPMDPREGNGPDSYCCPKE